MSSIKFIILVVVLSNMAYASKLEPGLWEVQMKILHDGKAVDPMAEVRKAMASMPKEQQEKMMKMMGKSGVSMGGPANNLTACYTKEMLDGEKAFDFKGQKDCDTKILKQSDKEVKTSFSCKDGTKGVAHWNIKSSKAYSGNVKVTDKTGKKSDLSYNMKFLKSECNKVQ